MDLIFHYDPDQQPDRPVPRDGEEARAILEEGNRTFCRWMAAFRSQTEQTPSPQEVMGTGDLAWLAGAFGRAPRQTPFAGVLGCSDARAPIELIFSQGFNHLFTNRVAGNVLGSEVLGSLEFAVKELHHSIQALVVLGHAECGAVKGAVEVFLNPESLWRANYSPHLRLILQRILPAVCEADQAIRAVWGPDAPAHPDYPSALKNATIALNAAHSAYTLRLETQTWGREVAVFYAVYDLLDFRVSMPFDPKVEHNCEDVNLAPAPTDPAAFSALALEMARILLPVPTPPAPTDGEVDPSETIPIESDDA